MAAKHKLLYLSEAEEDILDIVRYHADRVGPASARRIYQNFQKKLNRLREFPSLGPIHPDSELAALGYRKLILDEKYVAIYKVNDIDVVIYRIVNGRRDYPKLLQ